MPDVARQEAREAGQISRAALLAGLVACVIALLGAGVAIYVSRTESRQAKALAMQAEDIAKGNRRRIAENARQAADRRKIIQQEDVKICRRSHTLYVVLQSVEGQAVREAERLASSDTLSPVLRRSIRRQILQGKKFLRDLRQVDCRSVPSIAGSQPRKKVPVRPTAP